jgi:hypothetical protein
MRRTTLLLIALLAIAAPGSRAQGPDSRPAPAPARDPLDRRDWGAEVRQLRDAERAELGELARRARAAAPGAGQARAQRELEDAKRAWRRRLLEAQLARVRAAGLAEQAERIAQRIADLDAADRGRPAPAPAGGAR